MGLPPRGATAIATDTMPSDEVQDLLDSGWPLVDTWPRGASTVTTGRVLDMIAVHGLYLGSAANPTHTAATSDPVAVTVERVHDFPPWPGWGQPQHLPRHLMAQIPDLIAVRRKADATAVRGIETLTNEAALVGHAAGQYGLDATKELGRVLMAWRGYGSSRVST